LIAWATDSRPSERIGRISTGGTGLS
jgi:hypothetical protein